MHIRLNTHTCIRTHAHSSTQIILIYVLFQRDMWVAAVRELATAHRLAVDTSDTRPVKRVTHSMAAMSAVYRLTSRVALPLLEFSDGFDALKCAQTAKQLQRVGILNMDLVLAGSMSPRVREGTCDYLCYQHTHAYQTHTHSHMSPSSMQFFERQCACSIFLLIFF